MKLIWILAGVLITVLFLLPIFLNDYQIAALKLIRTYPLLAPFVIIGFRFLGVVAAPLPGAPVAFASIALLPWWQAFLYNIIGAELGAIMAFFIARKFRESVVAYFTPLQKVHEWQESITHRREFWAFVGLRFVSLTAFDFVSYAAGLSKLSFGAFFAATLLIDIPVNLLFFYFGGIAFEFSMYLFTLFAALLLAVIFVLRYSQKIKK